MSTRILYASLERLLELGIFLIVSCKNYLFFRLGKKVSSFLKFPKEKFTSTVFHFIVKESVSSQPFISHSSHNYFYQHLTIFLDSGICKQQDTSVINNVNKTRENETDIVPMIGAIIAVVFVVFLIVLIVCFCRKRKYKKKKRTRERATSLSEVKLKSTSGKSYHNAILLLCLYE